MPDASTLEKQEVLARAVIDPEGVITTGDTTHIDAAKEIRKQTTADNPRSATEYLVNRRELDKSKRIERSNRIGRKVNDEGKMDRTGDTDAATRFSKSEEYGEMIENLLEGTTDLTEARKFVRSIINTMPEAEKILSGVPEPTQDQVIDGWLKDPRFIAALRRNYDNLPTDGPTITEVFDAQNKFAEADEKKKKKEKEQEIVEKARADIGSEVTSFDPDISIGEGTRRISDLEGIGGIKERKRNEDIADINRRLKTAQTTARSKKIALSDAEERYPEADERVVRAKNAYQRAEDDIAAIRGELEEPQQEQQELLELRKRRDSVAARKQKLDEDSDRLISEIDTLKREASVAQTALNIITNAKETSDIKYVENLKSAMLTSLRDLAEVRTVA